MLSPWRFIAMTSMYSSWVIILLVPPVGLVQLVPKTLEGLSTDWVDAQPGGPGVSSTRHFADYGTRVSLIADRRFR
jgi:hypothetical protein